MSPSRALHFILALPLHLFSGDQLHADPHPSAATLKTTGVKFRAGVWPSQEEVDQPGGKPQVIQSLHPEMNPFLLSAI